MSDDEYRGYEVGPIRPPSEANSLLLRINRNCPWNKCRFCGLYKGERYSRRSVDDIKRDIDSIRSWTVYFSAKEAGIELPRPENEGSLLLNTAANWVNSRMRSIFLQDANSLVIKPADMIEVLMYLHAAFPDVERITSYARSQTVSRISDEDLRAMAQAGLNRIHIGLESGCDEVLRLVRKGADKEMHITAGQKVKKAGIELSEYFMPGLGGQEYSARNALETADALNRIDPDFIRIRSLAIPDNLGIASDYHDGTSTRTNDIRMAEELLLMIENLDGISSFLKNDHILNLFPEVQGRLPEDKEKMTAVIRKFLALPEEDQIIYRVGRRTGTMVLLKGLENEEKRDRISRIIAQNEITKDNIDEICDELMKRFI